MAEELRYTQEEIDALGAKGHAFKNADGHYSFPIDTVADLKKAIRAVGRSAADHDDVRKFIIGRAKALGESDLVPDAWAADGSVKEAANAAWTGEQRDTANDVFTAVQGAVSDLYGDPFCYTWVQDWYGSGGTGDPYVAIFYCQDCLWACEFSYDDDQKIVLGDPIKVRPITTYIERAENAIDSTDEGSMKVCPTCDGSGKTPDLDAPCPDCDGTGSVERKQKYSLKHTIEARKAKLPKRGEREVRTLPLEKLTISPSQNRAFDGEDNEGLPLLRFSGYASVFDKRYSVGPYEETIAPGAFKRSLSNPNLDCVLRIEHEDLPLARTTGSVTLTDGSEARTLTLSEDATGLRVEALLDPEDPDVQRLVPKFRRGDLREMSFAFRCNDDVWSDDYGLRTIRSAEIHRGDVAIVTYGASPTTTSELRSEKLEAFVHRYGFERFMDAMVEWRDWTNMSPEERAGKSISSTNAAFLQEMLDLFASADEAVDEGQARLSDFLGVANPDASDGDEPDGGDASDEDDDASADENATSDERGAEVIDITPRDHEFLLELRALGGGR